MSSHAIDERGYFWPAEVDFPKDHWAPEGGVYGRLKIDAEGSIELELDGTFANPNPRGDPDKLNLRTIAGRLKDGSRSVVIFEAASNRNTYHSHSFSHENYRGLYCAVASGGAHALINDCNSCKILDSTFDDYEEWLGLYSIENVRTSRSNAVKYVPIKDINIDLADRKSKISQRKFEHRYYERKLSSISIDQRSQLRYRFFKNVSIDVIVKEHMRFHDLLILLTNYTCSIDWPIIRRSSKSNPITLYYLRPFKYNDELMAHRCWVPFRDIAGDFGTILQNWITKSEEYGAAFYSYFSTRRGSSLFTEHKFVSLVWGLEAFHRSCRPLVEDKALKEKVTRIIASLASQEDQDWLSKRLKSVGSASLDQRLNDLFRGLPTGIGKNRIHSFSERCRINRNGLSHQGRVALGIDRNSEYLQLEKDCIGLSILYHCLILLEIGVSRDLIAKVVGKDSRHLDVIRRLEWAGLLQEKQRKIRVFNTDPKHKPTS